MLNPPPGPSLVKGFCLHPVDGDFDEELGR